MVKKIDAVLGHGVKREVAGCSRGRCTGGAVAPEVYGDDAGVQGQVLCDEGPRQGGVPRAVEQAVDGGAGRAGREMGAEGDGGGGGGGGRGEGLVDAEGARREQDLLLLLEKVGPFDGKEVFRGGFVEMARAADWYEWGKLTDVLF